MTRVLSLAALILVATTAAANAENTRRALTPEAFSRDWERWAGMSPQQVRWAPDGRGIYFMWNPDRADLPSLHVVDAAGGAPRKVPPEQAAHVPPLPRRSTGAIAASMQTRDGRRQVWERDGDIFLYDAATGRATRLTHTEAAELDPAFSHDEGEVTWQSGGNLFSYAIGTGSFTQLTRFRTGPADTAAQTDYQKYLARRQLEVFESLRGQAEMARAQQAQRTAEVGAPPAAVTLRPTQQVQDLVLSPDERTVTFLRTDSSEIDPAASTSDVARFVSSSGLLEVQKNPFGRVADPFREFALGVLDVATGRVRYVEGPAPGRKVNWNAVLWSPDGTQAVAWSGTRDHHDLWLSVIDVQTATARPIYHEADPAYHRGFRSGRYLGEEGAATVFRPDSRAIGFLAERDGWYHLYTVPLAGGEPRQLTKGDFEVARPSLSPDGKRWFFLSNEGDHLQLHLYSMPLEGGPRVRVTSGEGWHNSYQVSPDGSQVALVFGTPSAPRELVVRATAPDGAARTLTKSTTEEFHRYKWQRPEFVSFKDANGFTVQGSLLRPERPHPSRPAIIYVHGAGWMQGVTKDFAPYFEINRTQGQFYADQGYTFLAVDYNASRGYGRPSRVAVYKQVGRPEVASLVAAAEYLVKAHGVDRRRIGLYGHSYGGFLVNYALFTRPGVFAGGVAEAGQADYAQQGHTAFLTRLLGTPTEDEEAYRRASPIQHAEGFRDRLLMLHGALDATVPLQQPLMLAQRLMELKKTGWDLAVYPLEGHVPRLESSRLDMERRRFAFFESVLKGPRPAGPAAAAHEVSDVEAR